MRKHRKSKWHRLWRRCKKHFAAYLHREGRLWLWFGFGLVGVLAKSLLESIQAGQPYRLSWTGFVVALVTNLVIFRTTYYQYKSVRTRVPLLVQVSIAFVAGFTWQGLFRDLSVTR